MIPREACSDKINKFMIVPNVEYHKALKLGTPSFHKREKYLGTKIAAPPGAAYWSVNLGEGAIALPNLPPLVRRYPTFSLRPEQIPIFDMAKRVRGGVVEFKTGGGKSVIMMALCQCWGGKTLILVHAKDMVQQFYDGFNKFMNIEVGRFNSDHKDIRDITITTFTSARKYEEMFSKQGFYNLIIDEADAFFTDKSRDFVSRFPARRVFAFTATTRTAFDEFIPKSFQRTCRGTLFRFYGLDIMSATKKQAKLGGRNEGLSDNGKNDSARGEATPRTGARQATASADDNKYTRSVAPGSRESGGDANVAHEGPSSTALPEGTYECVLRGILHRLFKHPEGGYKDEFGLALKPADDWTAFRKALDADQNRKRAQMEYIKANHNDSCDRTLVLMDRVADVIGFYTAARGGSPNGGSDTGGVSGAPESPRTRTASAGTPRKDSGISPEKVYIIHGKVKKKDREEQKARFLKEGGIMFAQHQTSSRGIDYPECNKVFMMFPIKGETILRQAIGRAIRWLPGKKAYVYDFVDQSLLYQWTCRKKIYQEFFPEVPITQI